MKRHRFFAELKRSASSGSFVDRDVIHQIVRVLKLRSGEAITVLDGKGIERDLELTVVGDNEVMGNIVAERENKSEPSYPITLYAAILKRENFEWAVQKAAECGATRIVPVVSRRTIKKDVKQERLQEIAKEAAELSGRGIIPKVDEPMDLEDALTDAKSNHANFFFDVSSNEPELRQKGSVGLFVGPEGGWDEAELENAKRAGFTIASLGPRVLRGETACAVAVYLFAL